MNQVKIWAITGACRYENGVLQEVYKHPAYSATHDKHMVDVADYDALKRRVAELEKDAERYRWLRDAANEPRSNTSVFMQDPGGGVMFEDGFGADALDAAIDAAMTPDADGARHE